MQPRPSSPCVPRRTLASRGYAVTRAAVVRRFAPLAQRRVQVSIDNRTLYGGREAKMVVGKGGWRVVSQAR